MFYKFYLATACLAVLAAGAVSCVNTDDLESRLDGIEDKVEALEEVVRQINDNAIAAYTLITEGQIVMDVHAYDDGTLYRIDMSDGSSIDIYVAEDGGGITPVIGVDENGNWIYSIDGGTEWTTVDGTASATPQFRVNTDGAWEISTDGGTVWTEVTDENGNKMMANSGTFSDSFFTSVEYSQEDGTLDIVLATGESISIPVYQSLTMEVSDYEEGMSILLGQELTFDVTFSDDVADAIVKTCPDGWRVQITEEGQFIVTGPSSKTGEGEYTVEIWLQSAEPEQYIRKYRFTFNFIPLTDYNPSDTRAWHEFLLEDEDNVLLDFSYAGYNHGETAPPEVSGLGYTTYDVTDYGAVPNDGISDRDAFIAALTAAVGPISAENENGITFTGNDNARAIVYFPEGEFILHTSEDNIEDSSYPEGYYTRPINIRAGNFVLKGAGRGKTKLVMQDPAMPASDAMYSSPAMIAFRHNTSHSSQTNVTGDAAKGSFSVEVSSTYGISEGDWVCLYVLEDSDEALQYELGDYYTLDRRVPNWAISTGGVEVEDYHQVADVSGNTVTFREPLMHDVDASWGWRIDSYPNYSNVGVEDLTFVGNAKEDFVHHGTWEDDGAFKPLYFVRLTNSWIRRVGFESVSEALSITSSANVSAYDITISGNRGHSSIRAERSSRVFIGATSDVSSGPVSANSAVGTEGDYLEGAGQYHAVGVSKPSIGTVLWRNQWGKDACFESHATQPRATLIDCCTGGWMQLRQGGDAIQMPNHLADLTVWNFNSTNDWAGTFEWWDLDSEWWKFMPPVIVGFHGGAVTFDETQTKRIESNGTPVTPESLYEAQLENRLGYVPSWLTALKTASASN